VSFRINSRSNLKNFYRENEFIYMELSHIDNKISSLFEVWHFTHCTCVYNPTLEGGIKFTNRKRLLDKTPSVHLFRIIYTHIFKYSIIHYVHTRFWNTKINLLLLALLWKFKMPHKMYQLTELKIQFGNKLRIIRTHPVWTSSLRLIKKLRKTYKHVV